MNEIILELDTTATRLWTMVEESGLYSRQLKDIFFLLHKLQIDSHPASYTMGNGDSLPTVKRQGREADHSPSSTAEVKNDGATSQALQTSSWVDT
jgi:hypothetical protein